jgi:hypothetical protein
MSEPDPHVIDDETLRLYLADALPAGALARVEKALRDSAELRGRLEDVRQNRGDAQLHTLGAIWRNSRLTCPTRQQLGSYLLDVLEPEMADYIKFHIDVVECPFCQANLADLQDKATQPPTAFAHRHNRILRSIKDKMGEDGRA